MTDETWRCFVAVPIDDVLRDDLRIVAESWRERTDLAGLRWTDPDAWHVTLAFLGPTESATVPALIERLAAVAEAHEVSSSATGGIGAFPSAARARVAWYGVEDPDTRLADLAADVATALGLDASRRLRPHVTLARVRRQPVDLRPLLSYASAPQGVLKIDRIQLMRSHTGKGPARYETLAAMKLSVRAGV
jgi:2'-5' RNA ligase